MTMAYYRYEHVDTHIVRIFNTFGPRMRPNDGRAIPTFIPQALRGEPLTIFGDGSQTQSFCYVDDLIEGIYRLMMSDYHEPVNIGNPHEMTIKEMAQLVIKLADSSSELVTKPLPENDPKVRQPDTRLANQLLDWQAGISIEAGLKRTIDWYRKLFADDKTS